MRGFGRRCDGWSRNELVGLLDKILPDGSRTAQLRSTSSAGQKISCRLSGLSSSTMEGICNKFRPSMGSCWHKSSECDDGRSTIKSVLMAGESFLARLKQGLLNTHWRIGERHMDWPESKFIASFCLTRYVHRASTAYGQA